MIPTTNTILALLDRAHAMHAKPEVIERLRWFAHFTEHGSISKTCTEFGIARTTFYRWYHRLDVHNLSSLENIPKSALLGVNRRIEQDKCSDCFFCTFKLWLRTYKERGMRKPAIYIALIAAFINISLFLFIMLPQVAGAASSWGPTLIVNTEAFQVIDDTDDSSNLFLQFGGTLNKRLTYDRVLTTFIFDDDLEVQGTVSGATLHAQDSITSSGSIAIERGASIDGQTFVVDAANNRVGIGTGSPESYEANNANDLVIKAAQSAGGGISIITDNDQVGRLSFGDHTTASYRGYVDYDHSDDSLALGTAGQDRVTIDASGNVGFKGAYLHGNNALYSPRVAFTNSDATTPVFTFNNDTDTGIGGAGATANTLSLITGGSSRLYINANGEIGIGSTSPDTELEVIGTMSGTALTVGSLKNCDTIVTDADGNLSCGTDTDTQFTGTGSLQNFFDNRYVEVGGDTMTGALSVQVDSGTGTGNTLVVDTKGLVYDATNKRVGVGTASPSYPLHIEQSLQNSYVAYFNNTDSNNDAYGVLIDTTGTNTNRYAIMARSNGGSNEVFKVAKSGDVTIGSATTGGGLAIKDDSNPILSIQEGSSETYRFLANNSSFQLEIDGTDAMNLSDTGNFNFNSGDVYFENSSGNVGVGTTTPTEELEVVGTISGAIVHAQDTISSSGTLVVDGSVTFNDVTYTFPFGDASASGKVLSSDGSGNLSWTDAATDTDTHFTGTGSLQNFFDNRYVEVGGDTMTGALNIDVAGVGLNVTGTMSGEYINISGTGSRALFAAEDGQVSVNTSTPTDNYALTVKARNSAGNNQGALSLRNYNTDSEGMNFILGDDHNYIDTQNSLNFTSSNSQSYTFQGDVSPNGTHNLGTTSSGGQWDTAYVRNISPRPNEGTLTIYSHGTNGDIAFDNYTNEVMRIKGNESVGIGTTTPDTKLEVSGSGSFTGTNARLGVGTATADTELEVIGTMSGTHLRSGTGLIVESGRVGIGTDSPVRPLHMFGTDNAMLRLEQTESGSPHNYVEFYDTGGITSYIGHGNGSNDNFTIYNYAGDVDIYSAGGNNVLLNPGSGWVGIRNANPSTTLDVGGTMSGTNLTISSLQGCDTIDTDAQGNFQCGTDDGGDGFSGTGSLQNFFDNRYVEVGGDTMTGALSIYKDAGTSTGNTLVVDTKGLVYDATNKRVGVGTTSPSAALDVAGDIEISGAGNSISIDGNRHLLYSSNTFLGDIDNAGGNVYIREDGQNTITIAGQDTIFGGAVTVNNDPVNIVQSVDSSTASLNVQADGGSALLYTFGSAYSESGGFEADGATLLTDSNLSAGLNLVSRHTSGDLGFFTGGAASGNQRMLIDSTGNIGIDTATPGSRLSVSGSTIIGNNIGSATADTELEVIGTMSGAHIRSGSGLIVEQGRVGIGTDSPTTKLHVSGDMAVGTVSNANGYDFVVNTGGNNGDGIMLTDGADLTVSGTQRAALLTNNSGNYGYLALYDSSGQNIVLRGDAESVFNERGNDNDFRIEGDTETNLFFADASTERIGIGTATPDTELEVVGTISGTTLHATDSLTSSGILVFEGAASGASLYVADGFAGSGLADCDTAGTSKLLWDVTTERFSCGTDTDTTIADTNTNQLTTFSLTGDSGTPETIAQGNTLDIAGGAEITTAVSATDTITINITDNTVDFAELQDTLDLDASTTLNFGESNFIYDLTSTGDFMIRDNGSAAFFVDDSGRIGIGTEDLVSNIELDVAANDTLVDLYLKRIDSTISNGTGLGFIRFAGTDGGSESSPLIGAGIQGQAAGTWATGDSPANLIFWTTPDSSSTLTERMRIRPDGKVGIGTATPTAKFDVIAVEYQTGAYLYSSGASVLALDNYSGTTGSGMNAHIMFGYRNVFDTELYRHGNTGSGGIVIKTQQTSTSDNAFRVITQNGSANNTVFKVRADGAVTAEGSFTGGGADLAEWFPTADPGMTPGDITCLDPKRPKHVKRCNSRELKMIGIYSTNPGFIGNSQMGMEGPSALIGLIGQVPVKVIGNVDIGDSITLSKTDSVGKRAGPYDPSICIAMEEHRGGEIGTVTCLLTRNTGSSGSAPIDSKSVADYLLKSFKDSMRLDDF